MLGLFVARRLAGFRIDRSGLTPGRFRGNSEDLIEGEVVDQNDPVVIRGELDDR